MKRHSRAEILAKLRQAQQLESRGQSQSEICKVLGISVMTFHRWRKEVGQIAQEPAAAVATEQDAGASDDADDVLKQIDELKLENGRLRKIIGDLLLEKLKIEEAAAASRSRKSAK